MGMIWRIKLICWNRGTGSNRKGPAVGGGAAEQKLAVAIAGRAALLLRCKLLTHSCSKSRFSGGTVGHWQQETV